MRINPTGIQDQVQRFLTGESSTDFGELALEIFHFQRLSNPVYASFCAELPEPTDWREIPALPLPAFRFARVSCFPEASIQRTFRTSGTTGDRRGEHHFESLELYRSSSLSGWRLAGLPATGILCLLPAPEEAPDSSLSCMAGWLADPDDFFLRTGKLDVDGLAGRIRQADGPVCLFGTALAFLNWFESITHPFILPPGSLAVETGGFKGSGRELPKEELYALFASKLGLAADAVWNEYGMTELSSQAYSRGLGRLHRLPPWMRAMVVDPSGGNEVEVGEVGVLRFFDLANTGSVLAVQTRDLAVRQEGGFELIGRDPTALPRGCSLSADALLRQSG